MKQGCEHELKLTTKFRIELRNGRTFDYDSRADRLDIKLVGNHLVITCHGAFVGAFDMSEIVFAATTPMYMLDGCFCSFTPSELEALKRYEKTMEMLKNH